jgi:putative oxidoreductase
MTFPQLAQFSDLALLILRFMIGLIFLTGGWSHLKDPEGRSKSIGMSKPFTIFLGAAEIAGAIGLIVIMLGAIYKKLVVWRTGFWGKYGTNGWSYETMLVVMNLVIATTGGGILSLSRLFH